MHIIIQDLTGFADTVKHIFRVNFILAWIKSSSVQDNEELEPVSAKKKKKISRELNIKRHR